MVITADAGLYSYQSLRMIIDAGADAILRVGANVGLPVVRWLPDGSYLSCITEPGEKSTHYLAGYLSCAPSASSAARPRARRLFPLKKLTSATRAAIEEILEKPKSNRGERSCPRRVKRTRHNSYTRENRKIRTSAIALRQPLRSSTLPLNLTALTATAIQTVTD
jgi:hypothetical protein